MPSKIQPLLPVLLCVLALPLCSLLVHPGVELGVLDDWSYIRTAQVLAATGHIVYNGWAATMLGWQLYLGALLIKVFGFSFSIVRLGTLLVAMGTAALMQRLLVRLGITEWNSAAATLVFLLSPVYLAMTFSFMSDVYGVFVLVWCFYCCIRALQASREGRATAWIVAAALTNSVGGSARQITWLGLLVMVPCTLWLLRRRRLPFRLGVGATLVGLVVMYGLLRWFKVQPYSIGEPFLPPAIPAPRLLVFHYLVPFAKRTVCELLFLSMPLLLALLPGISRSRRTRVAAGVCCVVAGVVALNAYRTHTLLGWTFPYIFNGVWFGGFDDFHAYLGYGPVLLTLPVRVGLTVLLLLGGLALVSVLVVGRRVVDVEDARGSGSVTGSDLAVVLLPCTLAYLLLLVTRLITTSFLDRYLLFPEFAFLVMAVSFYQRNVRQGLPRGVWGTIALGGVLSAAGLHDTFALYRAQAALLAEMQTAGVPRTAIDGGAQFNGWTQIVTAEHLNDRRINTPLNIYLPLPRVPTDDPCRTEDLQLTPAVRARYVVSFDPGACGGPSAFPPVAFRTWFGPHERTMYAVKGPYR